MEDRQILCNSCGNEFTFTGEEQEFFSSKGFQDPKKCKPCRDAAKQSRGRGPRQLYDAVCASCGLQTQVPFQPSEGRPVYCRSCYQSQAAY